MLFAGEPLFLGGGDDLAVDDERGGAVVIERGDAEDGDGHSYFLSHQIAENPGAASWTWRMMKP